MASVYDMLHKHAKAAPRAPEWSRWPGRNRIAWPPGRPVLVLSAQRAQDLTRIVRSLGCTRRRRLPTIGPGSDKEGRDGPDVRVVRLAEQCRQAARRSGPRGRPRGGV